LAMHKNAFDLMPKGIGVYRFEVNRI